MIQAGRDRLFRWLKGLMLGHLHAMITCREFEDFVLDYLDGGLAARQRKQFEWHLRLCRECRDYLAAYRHTMSVTRETMRSTHDTLPDDVPPDLIKAVLDARKR